MGMPPTIVLIDAQYLSLISKEFGGGRPIQFDINQLAYTLAKSEGLWCTGVRFYTAPPFQDSPPSDDDKLRMAKYDKFVSKLRAISGFVVKEGRCQKVDGRFKQKGVDTHVILDLSDIASEKKVKDIVLLACDTDFAPVIEHIRKKHSTKVILYYYSDFKRGSKFSMSNHLSKVCDKCVLLSKEHFDRSSLQRK